MGARCLPVLAGLKTQSLRRCVHIGAGCRAVPFWNGTSLRITQYSPIPKAARHLNLYFGSVDQKQDVSESALLGAFAALMRFVDEDENMQQANASLSPSEQLSDLGHRIGITEALALMIGSAGIMVWLHRTVFRPVFEIRDAIKNFASAQSDAHTAIHGPEESRFIATQFNERSGSRARQHQNQGAFLASIADDLRDPISALKLSADMLSGPAATPECPGARGPHSSGNRGENGHELQIHIPLKRPGRLWRDGDIRFPDGAVFHRLLNEQERSK